MLGLGPIELLIIGSICVGIPAIIVIVILVLYKKKQEPREDQE